MKKSYIIFLILFVVVNFLLIKADNGIKIYKKDGTIIFIPSENIDYVEFTNYDDQEDKNNQENLLANVFVNVKFVYDYNMSYTDQFKDQVGSVDLYSFDQDNVFLRRYSLSKVNMNGEIDFTMHFDTTDFKPGKTYHIVAMAQGNHAGYEASLETPGFVPVHPMVEGQTKLSDYIFKLDRDDDGTYDFGIVNYKDVYGNNHEMIDTVWCTKPDEVQTIHIPYIEYKPTAEPQPDNHYEVTIPMMRITNAITVNLLSGSFTENTNTEAYNVLIHFPSGNGTIDFTGNTYPDQPLYYQTLRKNMIVYPPISQRSTRADEIVVGSNQWALQSEFGVSRLQMNDESSLQIRDAKTDDMVAEIPNFSKFLANAFNYYGQENGQEFLDREYEFEITLALKDPGTEPDPGPGIDDRTDNWVWIEVHLCNSGWTTRIINPHF